MCLDVGVRARRWPLKRLIRLECSRGRQNKQEGCPRLGDSRRANTQAFLVSLVSRRELSHESAPRLLFAEPSS